MYGRVVRSPWRLRRLLAVVLLVGVSGPACWGEPASTNDDDGSWRIQVSTADKSYRVRPDGREWSEVTHQKWRGGLSPDGKRVVYTGAPEDESRLFDSEIFVADADGGNEQRLTDNDAHDNTPIWARDGKRILFASDRSGRLQLYAMDPDGTNVESLTNEVEGAQLPKLSPEGRLAYLAIRKRQGKLWFQDLIVRDGAASRAIVKDSWLYADYAWSPDSKSIVYGKIGSLVFHDLASGKETPIDFTQIDPQMKSHAAFNIAWRPDGQAVASSMMFFGGRQEGGPKIIGDEEIFIIPREGKPTWFTNHLLHGNPPRTLSWVRK